jgi:hypothetical protein
MAPIKMTKQEELEAIRNFLGKHEGGASSAEIEAAIHIERRTLLRRLEKLVTQEFVTLSGQGRATRYHAVMNSKEPEAHGETNKSPIPLSAQGAKISSAVSQPLQRRKPVAYNLNFL